MKLFCHKCQADQKISIKLWRGHYKKAVCTYCKQEIKFLSFDEDQEYEKEIRPNKKKSNDRIVGVSEILTYGFF